MWKSQKRDEQIEERKIGARNNRRGSKAYAQANWKRISGKMIFRNILQNIILFELENGFIFKNGTIIITIIVLKKKLTNFFYFPF